MSYGGEQCIFIIVNVYIALHMRLHLIFTAAQSTDNTQGQQLPCFNVDAFPGIEIAEAESRKIVLNMLQLIRCASTHGINIFRAENRFLNSKPFLKAGSSVVVD